MHQSALSPSARRLFALLSAVLLLALPARVSAQGNHVVISQVYGGGGNSGATYSNDFIELYNPTGSAVDISGWSIQQASASGSSWNQFNFPAGASIAAGKFYLIKTAAGSTPAQDFTADFDISKRTTSDSGQAFTINLGAGSGKVALVSNQTVLSGTTLTPAAPLSGASASSSSCPSVNAAAIVDFVGYGASAATCFEGTSAAPAPSGNTTSITRGSTPADTNVNGADFALLSPPNPRNSTYGSAAPTALAIASTSATPSSVTAGGVTTLSVTVTPGTSSAGIAVAADLSQLGGSTTQAFTPSATPNVFTYAATVGSSVAANTYNIPVTASDQQGGLATGTVSVTVQPAVAVTPISQLQGNRATYVGTTVTTTGIVTLVTNAGFFVQTPSTTPGSTGNAEGLYVYAGGGKVPATAVVGNSVNVTGLLQVYPAATASHTPALELTQPAVTVLAQSQPLPPAITLPAGVPSAAGGIYQLTKYEGMLVTVPSLTTTSGTDGNLNEQTETVTSSGQIYAVLTGTPRPFREPGIDFRDFPASTCPSLTNCTSTATSAGVARPANVVLFDDNPERLIVETSLGGGQPLDLSAGAVLTNLTGVIDLSYSTDVPYGDPARLILQPGAVTVASPGITVQPLAKPAANQITVAAYNIERFYNTSAADDLYYLPTTGNTAKTSAVDVTQPAYTRRLQKVALAIRTVLNYPDVLSLEEAENVSVLQDISAEISREAIAAGEPDPAYVAYGTDSVTSFSNDGTGISTGFLVKPATIGVVSYTQVGNTTTFTPTGGNNQTLNDRPSEVLKVTVKRSTAAGTATGYPLTIISNHLKALTGVNTAQPNTRQKKELQAEMLANLIQTGQAAGEHVIAVGDLNAFEFSDGYTDTLGTITGRVSPAGTAAQDGTAIVNPAATDLVTLLPAAQRQSYTEFGNAQVLDHVVVTQDLVSSTTLAYAHINADFPLVSYNDATTPARNSDHDPALAYVTVPAPVLSATLTGNGTFPSTVIGNSSAGQGFVLTNTGQAPLAISGIAATGDFAQSNNCGTTLAVGGACAINVVFTPTAAGNRTGTLTVTAPGVTIPAINLTGTAPTPDFSLSATGGTLNLTVNSGSSATVNFSIQSSGGFKGTVNLSCVASGPSTGITCTVPASVAVPPGTFTVTLATTQLLRNVRTAGLSSGASGSRLPWLASLALLLLTAANAGRLRRLSRSAGGRLALALLLLLAAATAITGCGGGRSLNPSGTPPGTYSFTVTATSGSVSHNQTINLTVK